MVGLSILAASAIVNAYAQVDGAPVRRPRNELRVANGFNTVYGPNGLIVVPTASETPENTVSFGSFHSGKETGPSANWGITRWASVGGAILDRHGADDKAIANGKLRILPANLPWLDIGIGVIDAFDAIDQSFYVVGSSYLNVPNDMEEEAMGFKVHAGVGTGMFRERLFGGAEMLINNRWSVVGEWDAKNFNGALRYAHDDNFRLQGGFKHTSLFLGATYTMRF